MTQHTLTSIIKVIRHRQEWDRMVDRARRTLAVNAPHERRARLAIDANYPIVLAEPTLETM